MSHDMVEPRDDSIGQFTFMLTPPSRPYFGKPVAALLGLIGPSFKHAINLQYRDDLKNEHMDGTTHKVAKKVIPRACR